MNRVFSPTPSLVALVAGLILGIVAFKTKLPLLLSLESLVAPLGQIWMRALQMTVLPLVVAGLVTAILTNSESQAFRRAGLGAFGLFLAYLVAGATFSVFVGGALISVMPVSEETVQGFSALSSTASKISNGVKANPEIGTWLISLVPTNPFQALSEGHLLPVLIFTIAFALAATKISTANRQTIYSFFHGASEIMMILVNWILLATPIGIFSLALTISASVGTDAASVLVQYLALICGHLVAFTVLLYPFTAILGGVGVSTFARGAIPAQLVAIATRSSLASLPALLEGAKERMGLRAGVTDIVLPLAVSMFKSNRAISSVIKLLFIAHIFGIELTGVQITTFVITIIIVSFSAVGIPLGGGGMKSLPAYLAAGIPVEAYLMFKTVEAIPDIFKTLLNVTADLSVATLLNRMVPYSSKELDAPAVGSARMLVREAEADPGRKRP